jgi:Flp pilus assembly CpaF family ATPase
MVDDMVADISTDFLNYQYEVLGISSYLQDPDVTEICINKPGEVYLETSSGWQCVTVAGLTFDRARQFCTAVVNESNTGQRITDKDPVVSLTFPTGQRAQFVIPPACDAGKLSITIRLPSKHTKTLQQYEDDGFDADIGQTILDKVGSITRLLVDIKQAAESLSSIDDGGDYAETLYIIGISFKEIIGDGSYALDAIKENLPRHLRKKE